MKRRDHDYALYTGKYPLTQGPEKECMKDNIAIFLSVFLMELKSCNGGSKRCICWRSNIIKRFLNNSS